MRKSLIYIIVIFIALCTACKGSKTGGKSSTSDKEFALRLQVNLMEEKIEAMQMEIDEMQKEIRRHKDNFGVLVQDLYIDSLRHREIKLSQGYSINFAPQREYYNGVLSIYMNYMLKGNGIQKMLENEQYRTGEVVDVKDYFFLFELYGKPIEFYLYKKKTGSLCLHASSLKLDREKEAFIYFDYPDGDDNFYIYDLKTGHKTLLELPDQKKHPWVTYGNAYESVFIKGKRNGYYILGSTQSENKDEEFKIKISN